MRFAENNPIAVLPAAVVRDLPLRIDDRPFADFDDAVACREAGCLARMYELHMRPLITVIVDIIRDLAEQHAFVPQDAVGFSHEWGISVRKRISVLFRRTPAKTESRVEIL